MNTPTPTLTQSQIDELDRIRYLGHRAHNTFIEPRRHDNNDPVYNVCTRHLIPVLMKEIVSLSTLHRRPERKVVQAAKKAIAAVKATITQIETESTNDVKFDYETPEAPDPLLDTPARVKEKSLRTYDLNYHATKIHQESWERGYHYSPDFEFRNGFIGILAPWIVNFSNGFRCDENDVISEAEEALVHLRAAIPACKALWETRERARFMEDWQNSECESSSTHEENAVPPVCDVKPGDPCVEGRGDIPQAFYKLPPLLPQIAPPASNQEF